MLIGPSTKLGPALKTEWGTYDSPYFAAPIDGRGQLYLPDDMRGRHVFRTQPRSLSMLPTDTAWQGRGPIDVGMRARSSLVPTAPDYAHGVGADEPATSGWSNLLPWFVIAGILGFTTWYFKGAR